MAIIYTYPTKNATALDKILISDSEDELKTKQAPVSSIKDAIDVVDSIVAGSGISVSSATGNVTIGNTGVLSISSANAALTTSGSTAITLTSTPYSGGGNIGHVPAGGSSVNFLRGDGTWVVPAGGGGGTPATPLNSVQFNNNSAFGGSSKFTYTDSTSLLNIGEQDVSGAILNISGGQIGGAGQLRLGDDGTSGGIVTLKAATDIPSGDYDIVLPSLAPGSNNKILESDSSGQLSWITTPGEDTYTLQAEIKVGASVPLRLNAANGTDSTVNLTQGTGVSLTRNSANEITINTTNTLAAGNGVQIGSGTIQTDNLANGGIIYSGASNELAVDVGASAIIGTLPVARGGTGLSVSVATVNNALIGNGDYFVETGDVETAMLLPVGATNRRPSASAANVGLIRYNSGTTNFEVCKETAAESGLYSWYTIDVTIISP